MIPADLKDKLGDCSDREVSWTTDQDLSLYEYDGGVDKHGPDIVVFPRQCRRGRRDRQARERVQHADGWTRCRHGPERRSDSAPRRHHDRVRAHEPHPRTSTWRTSARWSSPAWSIWTSHLPSRQPKYFYAPDPSSQRACTIGGNVAENAGGPHTLAYGVTTNHVLGLEAVLPDGSIIETGGKAADLPGYDLTGLLTGSEGTMVLVTKVIVRLMRQPEVVKTILAIYDSTDDCRRTPWPRSPRAPLLPSRSRCSTA